MKEHLSLLGYKVSDVVTGFEGVCASINFDLYGCIQAVVTPPYNNDKKEQPEGKWFDISRLKKIGDGPVMALPAFLTSDKGPGEKSLPPSGPR